MRSVSECGTTSINSETTAHSPRPGSTQQNWKHSDPALFGVTLGEAMLRGSEVSSMEYRLTTYAGLIKTPGITLTQLTHTHIALVRLHNIYGETTNRHFPNILKIRHVISLPEPELI